MDIDRRTCCDHPGCDPAFRAADIGWAIERHGLFLARVAATHPGEVARTYTVGNHEHGLPELIVFGQSRPVARAVLTGLVEDLRAGRLDPTAGTLAVCPSLQLATLPLARLGAVAPRWARQLAPLALRHYGTPDAVELLQVVIPDGRGRLPSDPACSPWVRQEQPDLSREGELAWPTPYFPWLSDPDAPPGDVVVTVPVIASGDPTGRIEAVPARRDGDGRATLTAPPVLADWVTAGAVLELGRPAGIARVSHPEGGDWRRPLATAVRLAERSPNVHLAWSHGGSRAALDALCEARLRLESHGVVVTHSDGGLHATASARAAERARLAMRRLVRDGHATPLRPYHLPPPSTACCALS